MDLTLKQTRNARVQAPKLLTRGFQTRKKKKKKIDKNSCGKLKRGRYFLDHIFHQETAPVLLMLDVTAPCLKGSQICVHSLQRKIVLFLPLAYKYTGSPIRNLGLRLLRRRQLAMEDDVCKSSSIHFQP